MGTIIALGAYWQYLLFKKDKEIGPRRIYPAIIFIILVTLGILAHGIIALMDERNTEYLISTLFNNLMIVSVFGIGFVFKSYFGPILLSFTFAFITYNFFEFGEFNSIPFLEAFLDLVFAALPEWLEVLYIILSGVYILASSIHNTIN